MTRILLVFFLCVGLQGFGQTTLRHFMQQQPSPAGAVPYGNNSSAGHYVKADDARIYYEVYGKGEVLVLLHGGVYGSTYEMYQLIDSLSKYYRVIAVSTRGHGKSEIGHSPYTFEQKANDVLAVINDVTKDSVMVIGFSDGGYAGYKLASMYPARVKKLVAIGAGELEAGKRKFTFDLPYAMSLDSPYFKQQLTLMPEPQRLQAFWTKMETFYNSVTVGEELFSTIKCPVLLMAGELDMNSPLPTILAAYGHISTHQLSIIPGAPHPVFLTNFPAVWASLAPFLSQ
jgi:pimeloyl-ACP methyl ester carboxylesterase